MPTNSLGDSAVGQSIPAEEDHAVSVSLPTWKANVAYEEGEQWVLTRMKTGYPRFFIHLSIQKFADAIVLKYGSAGQKAMLFPSASIAEACLDFLERRVPSVKESSGIVELVPNPQKASGSEYLMTLSAISACVYPGEYASVAKAFWQHTGAGVSSRRAEYCCELFESGLLVRSLDRDVSLVPESPKKGPKRYRRHIADEAHQSPADTPRNVEAPHHYIEERFGRNLDISLASNAKIAIRKRIAGKLTADVDLTRALQLSTSEEVSKPRRGISEDDVYLYPTGMNAIFNAHQSLLRVRGAYKSVCYGFPYIDTLKTLEKFGPGCIFYGLGSQEDLDDLERRLKDGERILGLFCEFPGNPLLNSPDLARIRLLADRYDFMVVIDESIGNFLNVNVLPYADVIVSSLTKLFSGASNVMGGSAILNPKGRHYRTLKQTWEDIYQDNYWPADAIFMERNSRDFVSRSDRINHNAEAICDLLMSHPKVKRVYYPKYNSTKGLFDRCRNENGGYGGLLSATFYTKSDAVKFFDELRTAKGPSLGTNFTLSSPFVVLAHYNELDWAASFGVDPDLVRVSVGLEDTNELLDLFKIALAAIEHSQGKETV